jgi:hypothetical protein
MPEDKSVIHQHVQGISYGGPGEVVGCTQFILRGQQVPPLIAAILNQLAKLLI